MPTTLEQRINAGIATGQFALNEDLVEPRLVCLSCKESLLIDYLQLGMRPMYREMAKFMAEHTRRCKPPMRQEQFSISPARLERGMRRLLSCLSHGDDQTCDMCRGNTV